MRPRTTLSFVTLILLVVALASSWTGCSDAPTGADAALDVVAKTRFREALSAELQLEQGDDGFSLPISNAPLRGRAPLLADGALHLENASGQWIEVRAISRKPVAPVVSGNAAVYSDAETATDVVITLSRDRAEEFRVLRDPRAPLRIEYEVVLGPGIVGLQEDRNRVVAFDEEGRGAFRTLQAMAIDSSGSERALHVELVENEEGFRIVLELDAVGLSYPILVDPSWIMDGYWPPDVLVALGSISTGEDVTVNGNVSVQDAATQTLDGSELFVGPGSDIWGNAAADNAELQAQAVVHGSLSHNGLVLGTGAHATSGYLTPVTLPLAGDVPVMPLFQAGTTSVNVPNNATQTRSAGSYGTVTIGRRATLRLAGGVYNIESLTMGGPSTLQCDAPCDVRVKGRVAMDAATRIIPAPAVHPNPALPIEDVRIFVDGYNTTAAGSAARAMVVGAQAWLRARVFVPNGTLEIGAEADVEGRFIAREIDIADDVVVDGDGGARGPNCSAYCDKVMAAACPDGPSDYATCKDECPQMVADPYCSYQAGKAITCIAQTVGPLQCVNGLPHSSQCTALEQSYAACTATCAVTDDNNPCTVDACYCDPWSCGPGSVVHTPKKPGQSCDDGNLCNGVSACNGTGTCVAGAPPVIDDNDVCTGDACDPATGVVTHEPVDIDDGDACTLDECDSLTGIAHTPLAYQAACGPDRACNQEGECVGIPAVDAEEPDLSVATGVGSSTEFLYTGAAPVQTGVATGTIDFLRAGVIRGSVIDRDTGLPLEDVLIDIRNHLEYGATLSRESGHFDLAVNGGGYLDVHFEKEGYLAVDRRIHVRWQDYAVLDPVALVPFDSHVTTIDFSDPIEVARGSAITDADGTRQATILFPQGTTATMFVNGVPTARPTLNLRLTEYTMGANGPAAMPADLPPTSGYTYAVEISDDAAVTAGAERIELSTPAPLYVENFLGFPVGGVVPVGIYERSIGSWVPQPNGRVVKILSITASMANLDIDGTGVAASGAALAALGITNAERQTLATLYPVVGTTLWRAPLTHFSPCDLNWPYSPPDDSTAPDDDETGPDPDDDSDNDNDPRSGSDNTEDSEKNCEDEIASSVEMQTQILKQNIPIAGTPYSLHYQSDRVPGRAAAYSLPIGLIGPAVSPSLLRIELALEVAGQLHRQTFSTAPNQAIDFTWDGRDAYGRLVQGAQPLDVEISYVYPAYYDAPGAFGRAFEAFSATPGVELVAAPARGEFKVSRSWQREIGAWNARPHGLGGWTLSTHHTFDPVRGILHRGDGGRETNSTISAIVHGAAGGGATTFNYFTFASVEGAAATSVLIGEHVHSVVPSSDGGFFFSYPKLIFKVDGDGFLHHVAGISNSAYSGDGVPATTAGFGDQLRLAAAPDGGLYVADYNNRRIRHIDGTGIVRTIAGTGAAGTSASIGNGGVALSLAMSPFQITAAPDGTIYFSVTETQRVFSLTRDGMVRAIVGTGQSTPISSGDGGPALAAKLNNVRSIETGPDGSLYILDEQNVQTWLWRVSPNGVINLVMGQTGHCLSFEHAVPASDSCLRFAEGLAVDPDGTVYVASTGHNRVVSIARDGILRHVAGDGSTGTGPGLRGDGGAAVAARMIPRDVAVSADGNILIADSAAFGPTNSRVRKVKPIYGGAAEELFVVARDGREVYGFDGGRHMTTRHALTGGILYSFTYDGDGRLLSVTDGDQRTTIIEHDTAGDPVAVHAPSGADTLLTVDAAGYLETITNPEGETDTFSSTSDGLMLQHEDPRGHVATYEFDAQGALVRVNRTESSSSQELEAAPLPSGDAGRRIGRTSAQGRSWTYDVEPQMDGNELWAVTGPDGVTAMRQLGADGVNVTTRADGSATSVRLGADPRWGLRAPIQAERVLSTGSDPLTRRLLTQTHLRTITLGDPSDPTSLLAQVDALTINGKTFTTTYTDGTPSTMTRTTPAGRTWVTEIDDLGRPLRYLGPGVAPTVLAYDDGIANPLHKGRLRSVTQAARQVDLSYDTHGEVSSVSAMIDATSSTTVGFAYDAAGRLIDKTLADDHHLRLRYDDAGNLETVAQPGSADVFVSDDVHVLDHEARGLLSSYTAPDIGLANHSTSYEHSADGDLELITRPDDLTIDRVYDFYAPTGNLDRVVTDEGIVEYVHFPSTSSTAPGKLEAVVNHIDNVTVTFGYEGSLLTQTSWSGAIVGTYARAYDNDLRVASETVADNTAVFTYADPDGLLTQAGALTIARDPASGRIGPLTIGTLTEAIAYNTYGEPDGHTVSDGSATLYQINLVRDLLGRIEYKTETLGGPVPGAIAHRYRYDDAGRLWQVYQGAAPCDVGPCSLIATYGYDANGNRTTVTTSTGTATADYDAQDRLEGIDSPATSYTYTPAGELESRTDATGTTYFEYDVFGNLKRVTPPIPGAVITYLVDGQNRRVAKRVGGTMTQGFLYGDGPGPIAELAGDGTTVVARFVYATRYHVPDYMVKLVGPDAGTYRFITDQLGSVRMVVNVATGAVVQQIRYDAWGNPTLEHGTWSFQSFAFAGGLHDPATGLIRFGARDYDPALGRWTAKDPIRFAGGDSNLYAYVFSDPVNYIDPEGLLSGGEAGGGGIGVAGALVTVGVVVGIYVIWDWVEHRERDWTDGGDVQILPWPTEKCTPDDDVCGEGDEELPQICPLEEETQDWCIYRCGDGTTVQTRRHGHPVPGVYPENDVCPRRIGYH